MRGFQLGHRAQLFQDLYGGNPVRLLFDLSAMLVEAHCYRLRVGPVRETADLVTALVQNGPGQSENGENGGRSAATVPLL